MTDEAHPVNDDGPPRALLGCVAVAVGLVAALAALPAAAAGFAPIGDAEFLAFQDRWHGLDGDRLAWMFDTVRGGVSQPLAWVSLGIDATLGSPTAGAVHAGSIILHGLRAGLLALLFVAILWRDEEATGGPRAVLVAGALAAALWAGHPLRIESVAWASARGPLLGSTLLVGAGLAWVRAFGSPALRPGAVAAGVTLALLAVLADPLAVGAVAALVALAVWLRVTRRDSVAATRSLRSLVAMQLPLMIPALIGLVLATVADAAGTPAALPARLTAAGSGAMRALRSTLWPAGLHPAYDPPPGFPDSLDPGLLLDAGLATAVLVVTLVGLPRLRGSALVGLAFLGPLASQLALGHDPVGADRFADLATIPLFLAVARAAIGPSQSALRMRAGAVLAAAGLLLAVGASATQAERWDGGGALLDHVLDTDPLNERALVARGAAALAEGDLGAASAGYARKALEGGGARPYAHALYGRVLLELGDGEAETHLRAAVEAGPWLAAPHHDLGGLLLRRGEFQQARNLFARAARLDDQAPGVWFALGRAEQSLGNDGHAASAYRRALALDPGDAALQQALDEVE